MAKFLEYQAGMARERRDARPQRRVASSPEEAEDAAAGSAAP